MKKITATILSALLLTAATTAAGLAPKLLAPKATAQTPNARSATTEGYSALSYGSTLYLYSEDDGNAWQTYAHDFDIAEMRFAENGDLYFLDEESNLFTLATASFTESERATDTQIDCSYFGMQGEYLYYANVDFNPIKEQTTVTSVALSDLSTPVATKQFDKIFKSFTCANGKLYGLYGGALYQLSMEENESYTRLVAFPEEIVGGLSFTTDTVYFTTADKLIGYSLQSLTKSIELAGSFAAASAYADTLYLLDGDELKTYTLADGLQAASGAFTAPLVTALPTGNFKTDYENGADFEVVQTAENALLIEVDLEDATDVLPLKGVRRGEPLTALKVGENEAFALLSYQSADRNENIFYLVNKEKASLKTEAKITYPQAKIGYAVSGVTLAKYPRVSGPAFATALTRGEKINVLGEINGLAHSYYVVQRGEDIGYLPTSYITFVEGAPAQAETVILGEDGKADDSVWRLVYILLGGVIVCILADFLILRKKRDD